MKRNFEKILKNPGFDLERIREDFAYLKDKNPVIYLDNAATSQRPEPVLDRVMKFYRHENANPLRGNHRLSLFATQAYEDARERIKDWINADSKEEIIYTRNTTEGLNLISYLAALNLLKEGDQVLITRMEHHSNSVNWQFACQKTGAKLVYAELNDDFGLDMEDFKKKLNDRTKIVAFSGASNVLGAINPAKEMIRLAHEYGALTVLDGAQMAPHHRVDVKDLDCDFFAFSGHKMGAPFGIGVLYGKKKILEELPPFLYGGEMIEYVEDDSSTFAPLPYKFEAGTQNVGGAVGLAAAIDYMEKIGMDKIEAYERALTEYCVEKLRARGDIEIYHPAKGPTGCMVSFNLKGVHPHDVSTIMDAENVAIRSGHHCTQPLHRGLCITASCRASFAYYNTVEEVDKFLAAIDKVFEIMGL